MPGLLRGVARTAVVAGTATAVSNRVSRRQGERWAQEDQSQYAQQQDAQPQYVQAAPPPPAARPEDEMITNLNQLGELHEQGILIDEEFAAEKAKLLAGDRRTATKGVEVSDAGHHPTGLGWIEGKDSRLEVLNESPYVVSTPIGVLKGQRITDKHSLFVRNIQDRAEAHTLEPQSIEGWEIELVGLIEPSRVVIQAEELLDMEQVEYEMVLQCSGNGRAMYPSIPGTPWNQGGVGNVVFRGVPLSAVLEKHGVKVNPQVRFVTAEGLEGPMGRELPDLEHSLPIAEVLATSILALQMNGEDLPGIHGGPVRLVTPGFFGTVQIKWLERLRFETAESPCFYHAVEYRVPLEPVKPGEKFKFTLENSRPTWHIRLMSYILDPEPGAQLPAGPVTASGVAYNDGSARMEAVLVSFDHGQTWRPAEFETPESPYSWYQWSIQADLQPGAYQIWARAVDGLGRSQPLDGNVNWNPNGYEWTGVFKTEITVS